MATGQKSPPQFGFQGRNSNNLVSEPLDPVAEASDEQGSSSQFSRPEMIDARRSPVAEERFLMLEEISTTIWVPGKEL
ncbi:LETM1 and EF-hand domain-containing protein 1, mitochondrial-like [Iris pallida]|uniref:LETM1 and EF-hand domain-containing protein 1, mitochondrial-like n=1 Tax=Iris pallida TaxID=29817 RepID=A0AAX6H3E9_IRIPA|nr:LETM1 and EF-hand domain-containing protein 1, mitochondrial-like [Iris pallida]